jgi:hypothetical protein
VNKLKTLREAELETIITKALTELRLIRGKAELAENRKLIGKCFKYRNRYSSGSSWWLYLKVISADTSGVKVFQFETDEYGKVEIEITHARVHPDRGDIAITARQFNSAWKQTLARLDRMYRVASKP